MSLPFSSPTFLQTHRHYRLSKPIFQMASLRHHRRKDKIVVIMGATGSGKSRLSVDLAADHFPAAEIINSDKIQLYRGLDITTNKTPLSDRRRVAHHLLGEFDPNTELSSADFRSLADNVVASVASRGSLPIVAGGSNSFIHALLSDRIDPDFFSCQSDPVTSELRYSCCFLWVDVSSEVLSEYLSKRVDDMLDSGMFEELAEFYGKPDPGDCVGLRKAIGVPEFENYFKLYPPGWVGFGRPEGNDPVRGRVYEKAVREIKENTWRLVERQMGKIQRLREAGWDLKRVDATEAFRAAEERRPEIWKMEVVEPSVKIVKKFLENE